MNTLDLFGGSFQQGNMIHSLQKNMETPHFAGLTAETLMGDNEMNMFSTLPTAAT